MDNVDLLLIMAILIGTLFGHLVTDLIYKMSEQRRLLHPPHPATFSAKDAGPPPHMVPYEKWPPYTGWHNVLLLEDPHDSDTLSIGFVVQTTARLAKLDATKIEDSQRIGQALVGKLERGKVYVVWLYGRDKHGRTLVEIFNEKGDSINKWLVESGCAKPWEGNSKHPDAL